MNKKKKEYICKLAKAIKCMHDNGFVHRDLKPANISIKGDKLFLLDFGFAQHENQVSGMDGTPDYFPWYHNYQNSSIKDIRAIEAIEAIEDNVENLMEEPSFSFSMKFNVAKILDVFAFCKVAKELGTEIQISPQKNNQIPINALDSIKELFDTLSPPNKINKFETEYSGKEYGIDNIIKVLNCSPSGGKKRRTYKRRRSRKRAYRKKTYRKKTYRKKKL